MPAPAKVKIPCVVCGRVLLVPRKSFKENLLYFCPDVCYLVWYKIHKGWSSVRH